MAKKEKGLQPETAPKPAQPVDLTAQRDKRCMPIAKQILHMIADAELPVGDMTEEVRLKSYPPLAASILELLLQKNVLVSDVNYIFRLALEAFQKTQDMVANSVNKNWERASEKYWGKAIDECTMADLDKKLTQ